MFVRDITKEQRKRQQPLQAAATARGSRRQPLRRGGYVSGGRRRRRPQARQTPAPENPRYVIHTTPHSRSPVKIKTNRARCRRRTMFHLRSHDSSQRFVAQRHVTRPPSMSRSIGSRDVDGARLPPPQQSARRSGRAQRRAQAPRQHAAARRAARLNRHKRSETAQRRLLSALYSA